MFRFSHRILTNKVKAALRGANKDASPCALETLEVKSAVKSLTKHMKEAELKALINILGASHNQRSPCLHITDATNIIYQGKHIHALPLFLMYLCNVQKNTNLLDLMVNTDTEYVNSLFKSVPGCSSTGDVSSASSKASKICCNPYHWSKVLVPDLPPPPYSPRYTHEDTKPAEVDNEQRIIVTESDKTCSGLSPEIKDDPHHLHDDMKPPDGRKGGGTGGRGGGRWCSVAYWELQQRVGPLHHVYDNYVHVLHHLPRTHPHNGQQHTTRTDNQQQQQQQNSDIGDGEVGEGGGDVMCLYNLHQDFTITDPGQRPPVQLPAPPDHHQQHLPLHPQHQSTPPPAMAPAPDEVVKTRHKIGAGAIITIENHGAVWLHNRTTDQPMFVNTPMHDVISKQTVVTKLPPSCCMMIYDFSEMDTLRTVLDRGYGGAVCGGGGRGGGAPPFPSFLDGPYDWSAVRISFAKGWGGDRYKRQIITSCPCWIEVLFRRDYHM